MRSFGSRAYPFKLLWFSIQIQLCVQIEHFQELVLWASLSFLLWRARLLRAAMGKVGWHPSPASCVASSVGIVPGLCLASVVARTLGISLDEKTPPLLTPLQTEDLGPLVGPGAGAPACPHSKKETQGSVCKRSSVQGGPWREPGKGMDGSHRRGWMRAHGWRGWTGAT